MIQYNYISKNCNIGESFVVQFGSKKKYIFTMHHMNIVIIIYFRAVLRVICSHYINNYITIESCKIRYCLYQGQPKIKRRGKKTKVWYNTEICNEKFLSGCKW